MKLNFVYPVCAIKGIYIFGAHLTDQTDFIDEVECFLVYQFKYLK
jgi:hypothetical protein